MKFAKKTILPHFFYHKSRITLYQKNKKLLIKGPLYPPKTLK